jgi:hypothetical protein
MGEPAGKASVNIVKMARLGLRKELADAIGAKSRLTSGRRSAEAYRWFRTGI